MQEQLELAPLSNAEFVANVTRWANDRNLILGSSPDRQFLKLIEESGEYYESCELCNRDGREDAIGDTDVVLTIIIRQCGADPLISAEPSNAFLMTTLGKIAKAISKKKTEDLVLYARQARTRLEFIARSSNLDIAICRAKAWREIKDRTGWCENGIFYREEDRPCEQ